MLSLSGRYLHHEKKRCTSPELQQPITSAGSADCWHVVSNGRVIGHIGSKFLAMLPRRQRLQALDGWWQWLFGNALSSRGHSLCPGVYYYSYFYCCGEVFCNRVVIETSIVSKKTNLPLFNCSSLVFFCSDFSNSHPLFSYFIFHLYLHLDVIRLYLNSYHSGLLHRNLEKLQDRKKVAVSKPQRAANEDLVDCNISGSSLVAYNDYSKRSIALYSGKPQYFTFR